MKLTPPFILLIASGASIVIALALSGGSLGWSVKWNNYDTITYYCDKSLGYKRRLHAYQSLWVSFDEYESQKAKFGQVYQLLKTKIESWRALVRNLIFASLGIGVIAITSLLVSSLVPFVYNRPYALIGGRITTISTSTINGAVLAYALFTYYTSYPLLRHNNYTDPDSCYPDEDNVSTGFYMVSFACALYVTSAVCEVVIVIMDIKKNRQNDVVPT